MPVPSPLRRYAAPAAVLAGGVVLAVVVVASGPAGAASTDSTPSPSSTATPRPGETPLTGTTATRVREAVLAKYPGATIRRLETDSDGTYEAHIVTSDGQPLTVEVDEDFTVTGTEAGRPGKGGGPGFGRGVPLREQLTGDISTEVKDAVLEEYPGASVWIMWKESDGTYRAFVTTADGTRLVVRLDAEAAVTGADELPFRGDRRGNGHRDPGTAPAPTPSTTPSGTATTS